MNEKQAITGFVRELCEIARAEADKFEKEHGRMPTEMEAKQISDMVIRQAQLAIAMTKGSI